jgi:hypothetical protein
MAIDADLGYDGTEIIDRVVAFAGNKSGEFRDYVAKSLPFAIQRYAKMHDWSFLFQYNLALTVTEGTNEYILNVASIGFKMSTDNVSKIYATERSRQVVKRDITRLRDDRTFYNSAGAPAIGPKFWAEIGDSTIVFGPELFETQVLRVDGKVDTTAFETASAVWDLVSNPGAYDGVFPEIPYKYQEAFVEYVTALALDRENDDRSSQKKGEALALVRRDISDDTRRSGDELSLRMHSLKEYFGEDY